VTARAFGRGSTTRLYATYAAIALVPVLILGLVLAASYRSEARQRGLAVGRSEALLVAQTGVEPLLDGRPLSSGLTPSQVADLQRLVVHAVKGGEILRLRVRDLAGQVIFSDDGSGFREQPEDEAMDAAGGRVVGRLTKLNSDSNDTGDTGPETVEVYLPLQAGTPDRRVGVLEVYLPYAPIQAELTSGLHALYRDMTLGLAALYGALFVITMSVSRGLRRQVRLNRYQAEHDGLTGLPNRALFQRTGQEVLERAARSGTEAVVALIDLDRFKEVNDTLGHHSGDELLRQLADRLSEAIGPAGSVARLGGDEFGVILEDPGDPESTLQRLRRSIEAEVSVSGLPLSVGSSIGYVIAPADGDNMAQLVQRADVAMYLAKADHSGVCRYEKGRDHYDAAKLNLIAELRHGIDDGQLVIHYQPKAALPGRGTKAVEALVRWQHPDHGLLYPDSFVPLVEQTDLIDRLTSWVVTNALGQIATLGEEAADLAVAVNVSARNLTRPSFAAHVIDILHDAGVPPGRLIVEITETALLVDPARAAMVLGELTAAGVTVSIDDFGIGQTSLGYLSSLPVGELKIDKSFVKDMLANPAHAAIVRSVVELGHNLSLRVVAEGVEVAEVLDALGDIGCDLAQGFHIARPMPIDRLAEWLQPVGAGEDPAHDAAGPAVARVHP
jgi:diguanylate cyclase (GGDEF)-like protein